MCQIKARQYRRLAAECERQAELAAEEPMFREMQARLARSYSAQAETEDWLDGLLANGIGISPEHNREIVRAA